MRTSIQNPTSQAPGLPAPGSSFFDVSGDKRYELTNHLGNVLSVVSDNAPPDSYRDQQADLVCSNDYFPFGSQMLERSFSSGVYRFGFNTQERTDEIAGVGNHNTALFWEYDTRLGRRWNLDPKPISNESSYAASRNNPMWVSDPKGDFGEKANERRTERAQRKFEKKISKPLRELEVKLKNKEGISDNEIQTAVQAKADYLAEKYQNKRWLHIATRHENPAGENHRGSLTNFPNKNFIHIQAYSSSTTLLPIDASRPATKSMTNVVNTGVDLQIGSMVTVEFNPFEQPNSLVVNTINPSGASTEIFNTSGLISNPGFGLFTKSTIITHVNAGLLSFMVENSNSNIERDKWQLKIQIRSPLLLNPTPLYLSGNNSSNP